jgi:hypothetical protein
VDVRVSGGGDDVEEVVGSGRVYVDSSDLELIDDASYLGVQRVGLRFSSVSVPQGARVTSARVDFVVDEPDSVATSLSVRAAASDDAPAFRNVAFDVSGRPVTTAVVEWSNIAPWTVVGSTQRTPDLSSIVQEVVDRGGWVSGNSLALVFSGAGHRTAVSADGGPATAPRLLITYTTNGD